MLSFQLSASWCTGAFQISFFLKDQTKLCISCKAVCFLQRSIYSLQRPSWKRRFSLQDLSETKHFKDSNQDSTYKVVGQNCEQLWVSSWRANSAKVWNCHHSATTAMSPYARCCRSRSQPCTIIRQCRLAIRQSIYMGDFPATFEYQRVSVLLPTFLWCVATGVIRNQAEKGLSILVVSY